MDTRFLETFLIVVECGSIAEAARRLNMTSAAVAQRLRVLESELGQTLVVRAGRTVRPTAAGNAVQLHAPDLLRAARDLRSVAANDEPAGQLRIGATATALTGIVPDVIASLRAQYTQIDYFLQPGSSAELYRAVLDGKLDVALIIQPPFPVPKAFDWTTMRQESLLLISPDGPAISDVHSTITGQPFIRYDRSQWGGQVVERYLQRHSLVVREWAELDALEAIAALVNRGLGVALVPDWPPPWPEGLNLQKVLVEDGELRCMGVLSANSGPRVAVTRVFVHACKSLARNPNGRPGSVTRSSTTST